MSKMSRAVAALALLSVACGSAQTAGPMRADPCHEALAERCARGGCETFESSAARVRRPQPPGALYRYEIGTCGSYRFIHEQTMGDMTQYFDADGKLVASTSVADAPVCEDSFATSVGSIPSCVRTVTESRDYSQEVAPTP